MFKLNAPLLTLFKSVLITQKNITNNPLVDDDDTITKGFIVSQEAKQYCDAETLKKIEELYGYDVSALNNSFYKSFATVRDASQEKLWFDQILHYATTYGAEKLGLFDERNVYIPWQITDLPKGKPLKITFIGGLTVDQTKERILEMINTGFALSNATTTAIQKIIKELNINDIDIDIVRNREIKTFLYSLYKTVPKNSVEFLRYLVFETTGETLLIKNSYLITKIKFFNVKPAENLIKKYKTLNGLRPLAEIFNRYKPIWLAYKRTPYLNSVINKLNKLAKIYHKPLSPKILASITSSPNVDLPQLREELKKTNIFIKIRLLNSLRYRMAQPESILYKVRNGKAFAKEFTQKIQPNRYDEVYDVIYADVLAYITEKNKTQSIYIPDNVNFALPTSEKMFFGNIPFGTTISLGKKAVIGMHWEDTTQRVDLDLHLQNANSHFGWDARYQGNDLYYSGDMTSAPSPKGATEVFYLGDEIKSNAYLIKINHYNYYSDANVPYKLIIDAPQKADKINKNNVINQTTLLSTISNNIIAQENICGILTADENGDKKFHFYNLKFGKGITTTVNEKSNLAFYYLVKSGETQLRLKDVLLDAGVTMTSDSSGDVDLSLENITKDSFLSLL